MEYPRDRLSRVVRSTGESLFVEHIVISLWQVCMYADAILERVAAGFYCSGKYFSSATIRDCIKDPFCEFHLESTTCRAPDAYYIPGAREGLKVNLGMLSSFLNVCFTENDR